MGERLRDRVCSRERLLEVVETVCDSNVLHDITLVKDIGSSRGNDDVDLVLGSNGKVLASVDGYELLALLGRERFVSHLL